MKVLMLGAGAVGGYFGARLAEAGGDVSFLVRPPRAALLKASGLRIQSRAGDLTIQPRCVVAGEVKPDYDIVMVSAKAYDLPSAIEAITPAMAGSRAVVLPLLNGMSHLEALDARFGNSVPRILLHAAICRRELAVDVVRVEEAVVDRRHGIVDAAIPEQRGELSDGRGDRLCYWWVGVFC